MVYKYTKSFAEASGMKTKSEPWLHAVIDIDQEYGLNVAVYVWDTRKVVEQYQHKFKNYAEYRMFADNFYKRKYAKALDNGKPLQGLKGDKDIVEALQAAVRKSNH